MSQHIFTGGYMACGLGAGADGTLKARASIGRHVAQFRNLGGIDIDPAGLADFRKLTGGPTFLGDIHKMQPADLIAAWGERAPDFVFSSTPCKGLSRLLGSEAASTAHYQALNRLTLEAFHLVLATYNPPPKLMILENVPGIMSRGKDLLDQIRQLLVAHGYRIDERTHCAGELGGLGQRRRRFLLVARHEEQLPALLYSPPTQRVKACGEVLGPLPLPNDPSAGPMHVLPRISWINWVRLALIPPGGDWRDLPKGPPADGRPGRLSYEEATEAAESVGYYDDDLDGCVDVALDHEPRRGAFGVVSADEPAPTARGRADIRTGPASVADPRIPVGATGANAASFKGRPGYLGVLDFDRSAPSVTGNLGPTDGTSPGSVADPRLGVGEWANKHSSKYRMRSFDEPAGTITGDTDVQEGAQLVADPRLTSPLADGQPRREVHRRHAVADWNEAFDTVTGPGGAGVENIADPRIPLTCAPRAGAYGVADATRPIETVTGSAAIDNGVASIADGRELHPLPPGYVVMTIDEALAHATSPKARPPAGMVPVIFSPTDGTWHRPITTLELAVLQGLPATLNGEPLVLDGKSTAAWRERIGNAVPVGTARAIAEQMLRTLLAGALGMFVLGSTPIWVRHAQVPELYARRRREPASEPMREVA